jgi:hypothetical protein
MLGGSAYGGVEPQLAQSPRHVDTSSGIDRRFRPGKCTGNSWSDSHSDFVKPMGPAMATRTTSAWHPAASGQSTGSHLNRLCQGKSARGEVTGRG